MTAARLACAYLWAQAAVIAAWWLVLWLWPAARAPFVVGQWPESTLLAFWPADFAVFMAGSSFAALGIRRARPWARTLLCCVAGAAAYGTLFCVGSNLATGHGWLDTALMVPCCVANLLCVHATRPRRGPAEDPAR